MQTLIARLCLSASLLAFASRSYGDPKIFLDSVDNADHSNKITVTEWYIEPTELDHIPAYDPVADAPPVSIADAIKIARAQVDKELVPKSTVSLKTVELDQIDRGNTGETEPSIYGNIPTGKWYYKVTSSVTRPDPKTSICTYSVMVYVLMDGSISQRRERPSTKQEQEQDRQIFNALKASTTDPEKKRKEDK